MEQTIIDLFRDDSKDQITSKPTEMDSKVFEPSDPIERPTAAYDGDDFFEPEGSRQRQDSQGEGGAKKRLIEAEAKTFASTLDFAVCRICAAISGEDHKRYKIDASEKEEFTEVTKLYMETTGFGVNVHLQFWLSALAIFGGRFADSYQDRLERKKQDAERLRRAAEISAASTLYEPENSRMVEKVARVVPIDGGRNFTGGGTADEQQPEAKKQIEATAPEFILDMPARVEKKRRKRFEIDKSGFYIRNESGQYIKGEKTEKPVGQISKIIAQGKREGKTDAQINAACAAWLDGENS